MVSAISAPWITSFSVTGNVATAVVQTQPGRFYQLERNDDLSIGNWTETGGVVTGDGSVIHLTDTTTGSGGRAFYRVRCWLAESPAN